MKGFAIHNAITDHGGMIPATQSRTSQEGNLFVRAGDGHMCPKCKCWSVVIKSHDHIIMDGKPVAYVGDKLSCGAIIMPQQFHVVGDSGNPYSSASTTSSPVSSQSQQTTDSFVKDKYENYYIEQYKTDVYISHKAVLLGDEGVTPLDGAVSYFLNYKVQGKELFLSVVINAAPLSHKGTVYPFGTAIVSREGKEIARTKLKKEQGYWPTDKNKAPLGSCIIKLPEPNLQLVDVEFELGYTAVISDTVGSVHPMPPIKKYKFSLNSEARKV